MSRHLLVIGAQRCGTTYLQTVLDAHPDIAMARPSRPEPKVFCDEVLAAKGVDWYRATWFAHATSHQVLGDKSTSYLEDPDAPGRARAMLGDDVHVVAVLRDPVDRAVSNWQLSYEHGFETRPLEDALRENLTSPEPWDTTATSVSPFAYLERGRYLDQLRPWMDTFEDRVHVLFLPEILADEAALGGLWKTLDVDPGAAPPPREEAVNRSEGATPALSGELRGTVKAYFEADDRALSAHLGRPLPW